MFKSRHLSQFAFATVAATAALTGCQDAAPNKTSDVFNNLEAPAYGTDCVEFQGIKNCPLGNSKLSANTKGSLLVDGLKTAGSDGVAFLFPSAHEFDLDGEGIARSGSTLFSRAISEGVVTSTLTTRFTDEGFTATPVFTGSAGGAYSARFSLRGARVATLADLTGSVTAMIQHSCEPWPNCHWFAMDMKFLQLERDHPNVAAAAATDDLGACAWSFHFDEGRTFQVTLADGKQVTADTVDFVENVTKAGSYPYLAFDRLDYTSNTSSLRITTESAK